MEAAGEDVRTDVVSEVACHLDELPQEILFLILTHLRDVKEVASVSRVSKRFYSLLASNAIWKLLYCAKWEANPLLPNFLEVIGRPAEEVLKEDADDDTDGPSIKDAFKHKYFLEQRWFKGEWTRQSFLAHPGSSVNGLKFVASPSSSAPATLVTCSDDHTVRVWQPVAVAAPPEPAGDDSDSSFFFSNSPGSLFSSFRNSKIRNLGLSLTAKPQLECTDTLKGHQSVVWCVDYDGNVIVSGSHDESVIVWRDGAIAHNFAKVLDGGINGIILHENSVLARSRMGKEVVLTDIEACKHTVRYDSNSYGVFSFDASWEDNVLISCGGKALYCWDMRTSEPQFSYKIPTQMGRFEVLKLKTGTHLLATGDSDGDCAFWDLRVVSSAAMTPLAFAPASSSTSSTTSPSPSSSTSSSSPSPPSMGSPRLSSSPPLASLATYPSSSSSSSALFSSSSSPPAATSYLATSAASPGGGGLSSLAGATTVGSNKNPGHITSFIHGLSPVCGLYFDNSKLVSASKSGIIKVWDIGCSKDKSSQLARCKIDLGSKVWCFQADDRSLVCGDRGGFIHLVDFGADTRPRFGGMTADSKCSLQ
ncbi:Fbox domain containing protein [Acanthamoeba castellanii str. Neff]|uniref:Fbox domain containing protein n=1 Tax=Acanthamoeba castellanii (strain ATCC 30010 / Neff) TaxID=1257118 RepID=L8GDU7_ACACF|nr:Fbox domain containing protein [Acanthamoeba castellanii str. Neff]ELR11197.1 Fbox domain containing protein [Acanthamoeba castellanii str. Neff]